LDSSDFISTFIEKAKEIVIECDSDNNDVFAEEIISKIEATKEIRNSYLDFLNSVIENDKSSDTTSFVINFFEETRNSLYLFDGNRKTQYNLDLYAEHHSFLLWECFVCTIAYLWNYEYFAEINTILTHTYFFKSDVSNYDATEPMNFLALRFNSQILSNYSAHKQRISIVSDIMEKRQHEPLIGKKSFAYADVLLTQLSIALNISDSGWYWFALTYNNVGWNGYDGMWNKLQSREYCIKVLPLFGVDSVEKLIDLIKKQLIFFWNSNGGTKILKKSKN